MVRRLVEQQQIGTLQDQQRERQTGFLTARHRRDAARRRFVTESESSEEIAHFLLAHRRRNLAHQIEGGTARVELLEPMLREVADSRIGRMLDRTRPRHEPPRHPPQQRRLARSVRAEQCDSIARRQDHRNIAQHPPVVVSERRLLEPRYRPGGSLRFDEIEGEPLLRVERGDQLHPFERLESTLRLPRLARLVAESFDERLHSRPLALDTSGRSTGVLQLVGTQAFECTVVPGIDGDAAVPHQGDVIDDGVEKLAVVGDEQEGSGIAPQPGLQPYDRVEVEVIRRFVEEKKVRRCREGPRDRGAHSPAAGQGIERLRLIARCETESTQDTARIRLDCVAVDSLQIRMRRSLRLGVAAGFRACEPRTDRGDARIAAHDVVDEPDVCARRFLGDCRDRDIGRQLDVAAIGLELPQHQREDTRLARSVRPDHADLLPALHHQAGVLENRYTAAAQLDLVEADQRMLLPGLGGPSCTGYSQCIPARFCVPCAVTEH